MSTNILLIPDIIREISNKVDDVKTMSIMSRISKTFNKTLNFSDSESRKHLLRVVKEDQARDIECFPMNSYNGDNLLSRFLNYRLIERVKIEYQCFENGLREGFYRETSEDNIKLIKEGHYVKGKLEGNLVVKNGVDSDSFHFFYENNILQHITSYRGEQKLFKAHLSNKPYTGSREYPYFTDFINNVLMTCLRIESFDTSFYSSREFFEGYTITNMKIKDVDVKMEITSSSCDEMIKETRFKNGELIFTHIFENDMTKINSEFLRVETTIKDTNDEEYHDEEFYKDVENQDTESFFARAKGLETYYENGVVIGEIYYQDYHGYLSSANAISKVRKSHYKGFKIAKVFETTPWGNYFPILLLEDEQGVEHEIITSDSI